MLKVCLLAVGLLLLFPAITLASSLPVSSITNAINMPLIMQSAPQIDLSFGGEDDLSVAIQALVLITVLSFGPAFVTMMTSFTRIVVVFFFLRMGLGTQQSPPNKVLIGLALFLTIFIMMPTFETINDEAIQPYINDEITQMEALSEASVPLKEFMVRQTRDKELLFFMDMVGQESVEDVQNIPLYVVVPSYVMSELRIAFQIGFMIYLPFMVIDLVVASVLLAMGIMFLPPVLVSLPFKILVFVLTDGWYLLVQSLVQSFN
ncbi:flagellar type III secretion system pore protein FliP [Aliifodinibius sp. S!AR15-10]|uniref:flagellar type III secretion system pore protein FliP n=1 Tax=Aliifodinibius sp. S!AR15-10 TaxID=2950437 RepID=UPI002862ADA2|nr:flagellar type III secretion system pore protein FliP [Aliifodinibius sp. S!AR15-10]MDR8394242.1 flagellar type III secretion system pore protein FliP [Aliifodinibius sp. S!AR15-10]